MKRSSLIVSTGLAVVMGAAPAWAHGQPEATSTPEAWVDPIHAQLGESVEGALIEGDSRTSADGLMDRYVLDLQAGTRVEITMRSEAFDTYLIGGFLGPDGFEEIALDDDGLGEGLNSRLRFLAAETGRYEIRARGFAAMGAGDYQIGFAEQPAPVPGLAPGSIAVGGSLDGDLSDGDAEFDWANDYRYDAYRFRARSGERFEAQVRSSEFDATLMVMSESRWGVVEQLAFNDDGLNGGTDPRLRFSAPADGEYTLRVSSFSPGETGAYSLSLTALPALPPAVPVLVGEPQSGTIENGDADADDGRLYDAFVFRAEAGQRLELLASSDSFPVWLELGRSVGPAGWEALAFGDDGSGQAMNTRLLFSPTEAGEYAVRVGGTESSMRGAYSLSLNDRGPLPPAPPAGSMRIGDVVTGTLADGDGISPDEKYFDEYDIRLEPGQRVSARLDSDDYDSYLEIYRRQDDGTYGLVESDDDSGGALDSLVNFRPDGGDYRIRVTSFAMGEMGAYSLAVHELGEPARPMPLRLGRTVEGRLDERDGISDAGSPYDSYGLRIDQDQRVRFVARSDAFDTILFVVRRAGDEFEVVTYDDDGQGDGTTNSRLVVVGDEPGDYELWVMSYNPGGLGSYTLESENLGPSPQSAETSIGATIDGTLQDRDGIAAEGMTYDGYAFDGTAGQRLRVTMSSTEFDTFLLVGLHGEGGLAAIAENDDAGGNTDSAITITLPSDGRYEVWASSYAIGETGAYTLTLTDLGPEPEPGSLLIGSTIRGNLADSDPVGSGGTYHDAYRFDGEVDHTVRITATSNAFDTYIELGRWQDGVFIPLAEDDDGLSDLNSLLTVTLPETGAYIVRVRSFSPGQTGDYVLTVEEVPAI
ncbi:MAG: PPC domain-containing protein [Caulobacterales bacterium]|nr:PPC domain-containing protein [Caulobacterales bacterium]